MHLYLELIKAIFNKIILKKNTGSVVKEFSENHRNFETKSS